MARLKERTCRDCGCTENNACEGGCSWVAYDLCSECLAPKILLSESEAVEIYDALYGARRDLRKAFKTGQRGHVQWRTQEFASGEVRVFPMQSEEAIFQFVGLPYLPPEKR